MFEVKEKPKLVERAFLISVIRREDEREEAESLLEELSELVGNLGIEVRWKTVARARKTFPGHILGKGKLEEVVNQVRELNCDVIIFDNEISPGQQRNWEEEAKVLVIDRHEVILDVFATRAQTKECIHQAVRKFANEAHGIGQHDRSSTWQPYLPASWIKSRKEFVFGKHLRAGHAVKQS